MTLSYLDGFFFVPDLQCQRGWTEDSVVGWLCLSVGPHLPFFYCAHGCRLLVATWLGLFLSSVLLPWRQRSVAHSGAPASSLPAVSGEVCQAATRIQCSPGTKPGWSRIKMRLAQAFY